MEERESEKCHGNVNESHSKDAYRNRYRGEGGGRGATLNYKANKLRSKNEMKNTNIHKRDNRAHWGLEGHLNIAR